MSWSYWYRTFSYARSSLWIVPFLAIVLEQVTVRAVRPLDELMQYPFYDIGLEGTRAALDAVITLTLSFIVFTFGSLLVAIQVASGQLTPRIIATLLLRNNVVRFSVGLFVFTLLLAISARVGTEARINQFGAAICFILTLGSTSCFLYLIDYAARLLRPVSILAHVAEDGLSAIEAVYPRRRDAQPSDRGKPPALADRPRQVVYHRGSSGIVLAVNLDKLVAEAQRADCIVQVMAYVGDFVGVGEPLFQVYGGEVADEDRLRTAVAMGPERTMEQDPLFAFRILVDIAIKALSAAINDPTTAVCAIDQLHRLLRVVGRRHTGNEQVKDAAGSLRVVQRTPNWEDFVHLAVAEIRRYGADNVQIARRLRAMLENLIATLPERRHAALRLELDLLDRAIDKLYDFPEDAATARIADSQGLGASGVVTSTSVA